MTSSFSCKKCGLCCTTKDDNIKFIPLTIKEAIILAEYSGIPKEAFLKDDGLYYIEYVDGKCPYLTEERLCRLHSIGMKPANCSKFNCGEW